MTSMPIAAPSALNDLQAYAAKHDAIADRIEDQAIPKLKALKAQSVADYYSSQRLTKKEMITAIAVGALFVLAAAMIGVGIGLILGGVTAPIGLGLALAGAGLLAILGLGAQVVMIASAIRKDFQPEEYRETKAYNNYKTLESAAEDAREVAAEHRRMADEARKAKFEAELAVGTAKHRHNYGPLSEAPRMNREMQAFLKA